MCQLQEHRYQPCVLCRIGHTAHCWQEAILYMHGLSAYVPVAAHPSMCSFIWYADIGQRCKLSGQCPPSLSCRVETASFSGVCPCQLLTRCCQACPESNGITNLQLRHCSNSRRHATAHDWCDPRRATCKSAAWSAEHAEHIWQGTTKTCYDQGCRSQPLSPASTVATSKPITCAGR